MASPQNTTTSLCHRKYTEKNGKAKFLNTTGIDGICPGTLTAGGHYRCCAAGTTCLGYGVCHSDALPQGGSAFFMSSCTDPTYGDAAACTQRCTNQYLPDIIYTSSDLWACCGDDGTGKANCKNPTNYTFQDFPSPQDLAKTSSQNNNTSSVSGSVSSASTNAQFSATISPTATEAPTSDQKASGLPISAIAGIAVGAVVIILVFLAAFWLVRRRKKAVPQQTYTPVSTKPDTGEISNYPPKTYSPVELEQQVSQMLSTSDHGNRHELGYS